MRHAAHKALDIPLVRMVVRPVWRLALSRNMIIVELYSACVAIISWGIVPLLPGDTLASARAYSALTVVMRLAFGSYAETGCGLLFLAFGLFQFVAYVAGWLHLRMLAAQLGALIWFFVGVMVFLADRHSPDWSAYLLLGVFLSWARIRLSLWGH
jgi:hypothetical protein